MSKHSRVASHYKSASSALLGNLTILLEYVPLGIL